MATVAVTDGETINVYHDRGATEEVVRRVEAAGCAALVLTVDAPLLGRRERDVRNRFQLPEGLSVKNLLPAGMADLPIDTSPATINVLPRVAEAVDGRIEVLIDGGVRRGTDVIKAVALGARAVLLGRPIIWGLAVDGERGVAGCWKSCESSSIWRWRFADAHLWRLSGAIW